MIISNSNFVASCRLSIFVNFILLAICSVIMRGVSAAEDWAFGLPCREYSSHVFPSCLWNEALQVKHHHSYCWCFLCLRLMERRRVDEFWSVMAFLTSRGYGFWNEWWNECSGFCRRELVRGWGFCCGVRDFSLSVSQLDIPGSIRTQVVSERPRCAISCGESIVVVLWS